VQRNAQKPPSKICPLAGRYVRGNIMFIKTSFYTRSDIHAQLGGSMQSYLPTVNGQVVAACLKKSEDMNPKAPDIILPGTGEVVQRTAQQFEKQNYAVPTFIKREVGHWEYVGNYKVVRQSFDTQEIAKHSKDANRMDDVTSVLFLTEEK
jgi:hypothetical protein